MKEGLVTSTENEVGKRIALDFLTPLCQHYRVANTPCKIYRSYEGRSGSDWNRCLSVGDASRLTWKQRQAGIGTGQGKDRRVPGTALDLCLSAAERRIYLERQSGDSLS